MNNITGKYKRMLEIADQLKDMEINTIGDMKNFLFGVNNFAREMIENGYALEMGKTHPEELAKILGYGVAISEENFIN